MLKSVSAEDSLYLKNIIPVLVDASQNRNIGTARQVARSVKDYQVRFALYDLPSKTKINAELLYYKLSIFERLFPFYATVGLIMLIGLITWMGTVCRVSVSYHRTWIAMVHSRSFSNE